MVTKVDAGIFAGCDPVSEEWARARGAKWAVCTVTRVEFYPGRRIDFYRPKSVGEREAPEGPQYTYEPPKEYSVTGLVVKPGSAWIMAKEGRIGGMTAGREVVAYTGPGGRLPMPGEEVEKWVHVPAICYATEVPPETPMEPYVSDLYVVCQEMPSGKAVERLAAIRGEVLVRRKPGPRVRYVRALRKYLLPGPK